MKSLIQRVPGITRRQWRLSLGILGFASIGWIGATLILTQVRTCPLAMERKTQRNTHRSAQPNQLSLLSYNLRLRPRLLFVNGQNVRSQKFPDLMQNYDVLIFSEAFDDYVIQQLLQTLKPNYPHHTKPLGKNLGVSQDSGLVIASHWEIEQEYSQLFEGSCEGMSCFNIRGILGVRINKLGTRYHFLTAQLQSGDSPKAQKIRARQFAKIQQFIQTHNLIKDKIPLIFAASLPISPESQPEEYAQMLKVLGMSPSEVIGDLQYSVDPNQNTLAKSGEPQTPDALFTFNSQQQPKVSTLIRPMQTTPDQRWKSADWMYWQCPQQNLSDHHAIEGNLEYYD